ncbi:MAG: zinc ABC transporter substrate-binding protein [Fidelibacterota bacterium]|nr:MAG: zinc ABC transporter substrate-binding protein [Candidatus Neomarinimicrobiota bacterium]
MTRTSLITVLMIAAFPIRSLPADILRVVTATPDLADMVRAVGGDKVTVTSLSMGTQDLHLVEPRPSMVMQVKRADMLVRVGMDLDLWMQGIIDAARNSKVVYSGEGYIDASARIEKLQVPTGRVDMRLGDIHIYGNPHYWLDPANAPLILDDIADRLSRLLPSQATYFEQNLLRYTAEIDSAINEWQRIMDMYANVKIVTYHNSWIYFAERFNLQIVEYVEPKPGIPPTPSHIASLIEKMKEEQVKVIVIEPYFNLRIAEKVADRTGARILILPSSVGAEGVSSYLELFDYIIDQLAEAFSDQGG